MWSKIEHSNGAIVVENTASYDGDIRQERRIRNACQANRLVARSKREVPSNLDRDVLRRVGLMVRLQVRTTMHDRLHPKIG